MMTFFACSSYAFERALIFRSVSRSHSGSHVSGAVCLARGDDRVCDGNEVRNK